MCLGTLHNFTQELYVLQFSVSDWLVDVRFEVSYIPDVKMCCYWPEVD